MSHRIIIITGATGSGKSALAMAVAEKLGGTIINADSQQIYRDLRILSARPSPNDEAQAPHLLYGHVDGSQHYSTGQWLADATRAIQTCWQQQQLPILTGGTGLYLRAIMHGLATIPPTPSTIRLEASNRLKTLGIQAFATELLQHCPDLSGHIDTRNPARLLRAWEVFHTTGQSIRAWQQNTHPPLAAYQPQFIAAALAPNRSKLYENINLRIHHMLKQGALEEVKALAARNLPETLPIIKSHGFREFRAYLAGTMPLNDAIASAQQQTRHYAKRQHTWLRGQLPEIPKFPTADDAKNAIFLKY